MSIRPLTQSEIKKVVGAVVWPNPELSLADRIRSNHLTESGPTVNLVGGSIGSPPGSGDVGPTSPVFNGRSTEFDSLYDIDTNPFFPVNDESQARIEACWEAGEDDDCT